MVQGELEDGFGIDLEAGLRWRALAVTVPSVPHYENIDLKLEVENLNVLEPIADVASILVKVYDRLMRERVLLLDKPAPQRQLVLSHYTHILVLHVPFRGVSVRLRVVFRVAKGLIRCVGDVEHPILHDINHD